MKQRYRVASGGLRTVARAVLDSAGKPVIEQALVAKVELVPADLDGETSALTVQFEGADVKVARDLKLGDLIEAAFVRIAEPTAGAGEG